MIDSSNFHLYKTQLNNIGLFERDIINIVYGEDLGQEVVTTQPGPGDTPYLKSPEIDLWLKLVIK